MEDIKIVQIKENVLAKNDEEAKMVREQLRKHHAYLVNVMSSPGSGKTSLLLSLIPLLIEKGYRICVLEADIDGEPDAEKIIKETKAKAIQIHTGGACHLTAQMTKESLENIHLDDFDIVFLENIGNLVCPAEFDTGANLKLVLLSVPEGDDKPLKYPLMFEVADYLVVTKIDTLPVFDFSLERLEENAKKRNPNVRIFTCSAKKNEGVKEIAEAIEEEASQFLKGLMK